MVRQKLQQIIENEDMDGMISFLKELTPHERKSLLSTVRKIELGHSSNQYKKIEIKRLAIFVCTPTSEVKKINVWEMPELEYLDRVLPWYCPENLNDFPLKISSDNYVSYNYYIKWEEKGYLTLSPERIASILPLIIYEKNNETRDVKYVPENLVKHPITLQKHFWWLFEYPSGIEYYTNNVRYQNVNDPELKSCWFDAVIRYTSIGKLDRMKVLSECFLAVNRNFNKNETSWFVDLLMAMKPTTEELITLQKEIFSSLSCVWSRPVGYTLKLLKQIASDPRFHTEELFTYLPVLLVSEVKNNVILTITVLEVILKNRKEFISEICSSLCVAFLSKNEDIQKKTAEVLVKNIAPTTVFCETLANYEDNLLMSTRAILKDYIIEKERKEEDLAIASEDIQNAILPFIREDNKIPSVNTVENFVFFLLQAIDLPEPYFFDHLMNNMVLWGNEINESDLVLLEPVFKKIYNRFFKYNNPLLDGIPSLLLTDYGLYLLEKFPGKMKKLQSLRDKMDDVDKHGMQQSKYYSKWQIPLKNLRVELMYKGFREIAVGVIEKIKRKETLPLLSTPTHFPLWIDPSILIDKLVSYQQEGIEPLDMDMQLAIQRCALDFTEEALRKAQKSLTGEIKNMMVFLLDKDALPEQPIEHPSWWMTIAITKRANYSFPEFESFGYNKIPTAYITGDFQWETYINTGYNGNYEWKHLQITNAKPQFDLGKNKLFYKYIWEEENISASHYYYDKDDKDWVLYPYLAIPNNPDVLLAKITKCFANCDMCEIPEQKLALLTARLMHELKTPFHEIHYMALACFLLGRDKTVQNYGFEIWTENVSLDKLDAARLGNALGKVEFLEAFPLKRFTDLMAGNMIGISSKHNLFLLIMTEAFLSQLPEIPIKNQKRLLELYNELLALTKSKPQTHKITHWEKWATESSLKKIIKTIDL